MTPSHVSKQGRRPSKIASSHSTITSDLLVLNLACNAESHSLFRSKRRAHRAPNNIVIYPPLKRESDVFCFISPSPSASRTASTLKVKHAYTPSFPKILATLSKESFAETSASKNEPTVKKGFNLNNIFSSSSKISSTFHKVLREKRSITPTRHSENFSSAFAHSISSHDESNFLHTLLNSELKSPSISHVFSSETEDIMHSSKTSSLSSYLPPTSSFQCSFESKFTHLKNSRLNSKYLVLRGRH